MAKTNRSLATEVEFYNGYFRWLLDTVMYEEMKRSGRSYLYLLKHMRSVQFTWSIDKDVNRAEDGKYLRYTYQEISGQSGEIKGACNFLEMCIALATRMNDDIFDADPTARPARWFWIMMENCGLDRYTDEFYDEDDVDKIIERIIKRQYTRTGKGGFFPLKSVTKDQRKVEIWYQMQAYILENFDY